VSSRSNLKIVRAGGRPIAVEDVPRPKPARVEPSARTWARLPPHVQAAFHTVMRAIARKAG
jgi:hypothetical protein